MKTPPRLARIEEIFHAALERQPAERAAFLAEACGNDASLLDAVKALLAAHDQSFSLLDQRHAGAEFDNTSAPTRHLPDAPAQPPAPDPVLNSSGDGQREGRFVAGAMLAGRYRIVGLLGKGGMGEVYKAEDLKLNQTVALKFLPESIALDGGMLARFHNEVRIARQVAHPNVCRVYDIGEVQTDVGGLHFLSMEFIDGEDLSSLLRRIGRLPGDKAVEIARQMCAGLAAAHEAGVLHRDLKPANVMIDGRGKARITDFGLAVVSEELRGDEVMAGTPAYMAPEQLTGKEVTQRSDIYALGLVLYELFTGKRVFEAKSIQELISLHEKSTPPTPSSHVKEIDPLAERVILRCLEKDPKARPASAVQVALALPGGDPLQAALAMGETPSPEMVAASGEKTGLRPAAAVACLLAIIAGLIVATYLLSRYRLINVTPFEHSPEDLSQKARQMIAQLGYPDPPSDTARGFDYDRKYLNYLQSQFPAAEWRQRLSQSQPAPIFFWYRESPQQILPVKYSRISPLPGDLPDWSRNKEDDPPPSPEMVSVRLDMRGRLVRLIASPSQHAEAPRHLARSGNSESADWDELLAAAGIDRTRLTPIEPEWTPPSAFDTRAAWTGTFPEQPDLTMRVEAAAWRGRPVYFETIGPWTTPDRANTLWGGKYYYSGAVIFVLGLLFFGVLLAWRNLQQGRGDIQGTFKLVVYGTLVCLLSGLVGMHALSSLQIEIALALAITVAGATGVMYIALEPYVRRRWPQSLISWSRLLAGNVGDPLVGRDALFGVLFGIIIVIAIVLLRGLRWRNSDTLLRTLSSARQTASEFISLGHFPLEAALLCLFLLLLTRIMARRDWLAACLFTLVFFNSFPTGQWYMAIVSALYALMLMRFGLVTVMIALFVVFAWFNFPVTLDFSVWYARTGIAPLVAVLALAVFAFYTSLGGQKVFQGSLLEE